MLPSGRASVRVRLANGTRRRLGAYAAHEAEPMRAALVACLVDSGNAATGVMTLRAFGPIYLDHRETEERRKNIRTDRGRWRTHIADSALGEMALQSIQPTHVYALVDAVSKSKRTDPNARWRPTKATKAVSKTTVKHVLNLLRSTLEHAVRLGLIQSNPARSVKVPGTDGVTLHGEEWTYLLPDEQERLTHCEAIPEEERDLYAFAMGAGMREAEIYRLERRHLYLDDVAPHAYVARSKNGKTRRVALFGIALEAARRQAARHHGPLVWPSARGVMRAIGKAPRGWKEHLKAASIVAKGRHDKRDVRFHDLRHTCATSLLMGWFGRRWDLDEVKVQLGHSSRTVTERYAHFAQSAIDEAARETPGPKRGGGKGGGGNGDGGVGQSWPTAEAANEAKTPCTPGRIRTCDPRLRRPTPSVEIPNTCDTTWAKRGPIEVLQAIAAGDAIEGQRLAVELARAVLADPVVELATGVLDGGPLWAARAVRLAEALLDREAGHDVGKVGEACITKS